MFKNFRDVMVRLAAKERIYSDVVYIYLYSPMASRVTSPFLVTFLWVMPCAEVPSCSSVWGEHVVTGAPPPGYDVTLGPNPKQTTCGTVIKRIRKERRLNTLVSDQWRSDAVSWLMCCLESVISAGLFGAICLSKQTSCGCKECWSCFSWGK